MRGAVKPLGELLAGLGARLHSLRNQKGWTLEQLSLRTNLSEPFLSRIESGQRQPSLAALLTLARAHSLPLASLLEEVPAAASPPVVIQAGSSSEHYANGLQFRVVSGSALKSNLHAVHVMIPPEAGTSRFLPPRWRGMALRAVRASTPNIRGQGTPAEAGRFSAFRISHATSSGGERAARCRGRDRVVRRSITVSLASDQQATDVENTFWCKRPTPPPTIGCGCR